jgi:hypothetical protein
VAEVMGSEVVVTCAICQTGCGLVAEGGMGSCSGVSLPRFGGNRGICGVERGVFSSGIGERSWLGLCGGVVKV